MPTEYHHGVRVIELNDGARPIRTIATAVIGLVAIASDADPDVFPLNQMVLITNPQAAMASAGIQGTLIHALRGIVDQGNPVCIIIRVEPVGEGEVVTQTDIDTAVIGNCSPPTGLYALAGAQAQFGLKPRILGCPGLDTPAVALQLAALAENTRSFAYIAANGCATKEEAVAYRDTFGNREVMVIWPEFKGYDAVTGAPATLWATARALGLRAKIDEQVGWHKTISNVPVNGVSGISENVYFDLQTAASDADYLNGNEVTTLVNIKGFRFWGSRTCSADPLFAFENYTRTAHVLADSIAEAMLWAVDKPMHPSLVKDIIESINAKFRQLKALGYIIDGTCWYDESVNTSQSLKDGQLYIDYDYTPVPPLENLMLRQRITDRYLADFAQRIAAA